MKKEKNWRYGYVDHYVSVGDLIYGHYNPKETERICGELLEKTRDLFSYTTKEGKTMSLNEL